MQDLQIKVEQKPGVITANFDEIKEALAVQMTAYEDYTVTEEGIVEAKKDVATLRKIKAAIDDRRKEIKKEFSKPLTDFETEVKDMLAIIDKPINLINGKLDEFETARKEEKRKHLKELYEQNIGEYADFLPYDRIYNPKWENKTSTDKDVISDISEAITVVRSDLGSIKALESEIEDTCIEAYRAAGNDIKAAIKKNSDYIAAKQLAERKIKEEAERKAKEEAERKALEWDDKAAAEKLNAMQTEEPQETASGMTSEPVLRIEIVGQENIDKMKQFLEFSEIPYKEI